MAETCDLCGEEYTIVYCLPNSIWKTIYQGLVAFTDDFKEVYKERQRAEDGLLCITCCNDLAEKMGISLFFAGNVGSFGAEQILKEKIGSLCAGQEILEERIEKYKTQMNP